VTDRSKNKEDSAKIKKRIEEIEKLLDSTHIITEKYINPSNNNSSDKVEIYR